MCERKDGEHIVVFWWRQFIEHPVNLIAFAAVAGIIYLHQQQRQDFAAHREYMREQNALQVECIRGMTDSVHEVAEELRVLEILVKNESGNHK